MLNQLPSPLAEWVNRFACCFTRPGFERFLELILGAILCASRHTVSRMLCPLACLRGHFCNYHRFFSRTRFDLEALAEVLSDLVIACVPRNEPLVLAIDDTLVRRWGSRVWAKGCYRDAVRSSHQHTIKSFGHRWLVACVILKMPLCSVPWALPIRAMLYNSEKADQKLLCPHLPKTQLIQRMLRLLMKQYPDRRFIVLGDGGIASHELAVWCQRHSERIVLIGRLRGDANLYGPAVRKSRSGRIPLKGKKLPKPRDLIQDARLRRTARIAERDRTFIHDSCLWYNQHTKSEGKPATVVSVRWVGVVGEAGRSKQAQHHYFFSTDPAMTPEEVIAYYAMRWPIEVCFADARQWVGLESTREWCESSVKRMVPMQFGLMSLISLIWKKEVEATPPQQRQERFKPRGTPCYHKAQPSFADALFHVRRLCWPSQLPGWPGQLSPCKNLQGESCPPPPTLARLLDYLATAA